MTYFDTPVGGDDRHQADDTFGFTGLLIDDRIKPWVGRDLMPGQPCIKGTALDKGP